MEFQKKSKELLCEFLTHTTPELVAYLEGLRFFGNETRVDTRPIIFRGEEDVPPLRLSVYRPKELHGVAEPLRVVLLKRTFRGNWQLKLVLIPAPEKEHQGELLTMDQSVECLERFFPVCEEAKQAILGSISANR